MDLSEVMSGLHVLAQREGHQNNKISQRTVLIEQNFPWNLLGNEKQRDPRKILIAILSNQKVAAGHLGKLVFGADVCIVCIFWVLLCPKPQ